MLHSRFEYLNNYQFRQEPIGAFVACVWFFYLILSPVFIFSKGLPQPSDYFLVIGMLPILLHEASRREKNLPLIYLTGFLFCCLTFTINWINYFFYPDIKLILSSVYYIYNFLVFCFVVSLFKRDYHRVLYITFLGIALSVIIQFLWSQILPDPEGRRITAGFYSPNQFSYWALLVSGMLFYMRQDTVFRSIDLFLLFLLGYIQSLALSKAGIICYALMLIFMMFSTQMPRKIKFLMLFFFCIVGTYLIFEPQNAVHMFNNISALERIEERIENIGLEGDDSFEGRGYSRLMYYPEYLFVGAGEGAFDRFRSWANAKELHSSLATILFSYGIFGFALFITFVGMTIWKHPISHAGVMFSILLYGIASQSVRFTDFWIMLAVAYATYIYNPASHNFLTQTQHKIDPCDTNCDEHNELSFTGEAFR